MLRRLAHALMVGMLIVALGAAQGPKYSEARSNPSNTSPFQSKSENHPAKIQPFEVGTASWYGEDFDGKPTASGEDYDMYDMTAAHPSLPLGSYVKVTNLRNHRAVVVKVNDRGPVVPGRIIDLSKGAAEALQFQDRGLQRVRLDLVQPHVRSSRAYQMMAYNRTEPKQPLAEVR